MNRPRLRTLHGPHERAVLIGARRLKRGEGAQVLATNVRGPATKQFFRFLSSYNQITAWVIGTRKWSVLVLRDDDPTDCEEKW